MLIRSSSAAEGALRECEALLSALISRRPVRSWLVSSLWSSTSRWKHGARIVAWRERPGMTRICPDAVFSHPKLTRELELEIISVEVDDERANR